MRACRHCLLVLSIMLVLTAVLDVMVSPAHGQPAAILMFVHPENPTDLKSHEASDHVETVLERMLKHRFRRTEIRPVSWDHYKDRSVVWYVEGHNISHYIEAKVISTSGGLSMDLTLVADDAKKRELIWVGARNSTNMHAIQTRLRRVPILYDAMLAGIDFDNLIYVTCFQVEVDSPPENLQRSLTLELPWELEDTGMGDRYRVSGVDPLDFGLHCRMQQRPTEEEIELERDFFYLIQGFIRDVRDTPKDVEIRLYVHVEGRPKRLNPPRLALDTVVDDLASYIARCWGNWDAANCR